MHSAYVVVVVVVIETLVHGVALLRVDLADFGKPTDKTSTVERFAVTMTALAHLNTNLM